MFYPSNFTAEILSDPVYLFTDYHLFGLIN